MLLSSSGELKGRNNHAWLFTGKWDKASFYLILPCSRNFIFLAGSMSHGLTFDLKIISYLGTIDDKKFEPTDIVYFNFVLHTPLHLGMEIGGS